MKFDKDFNPGTGNHYTVINVGNIEHNYPNVSKLTIIKGADGTKTVTTSSSSDTATSSFTAADAVPSEPAIATQPMKDVIRTDILKYVANTLPMVSYLWKNKYMALWNEILNIPEVDAIIYKKGHQQHTTFNRKEVLHIICYLGKYADGGIGIFQDRYVAKYVALQLNDNCEKSTRPELGYKPSMPIQRAIDKLMKSAVCKSKK